MGPYFGPQFEDVGGMDLWMWLRSCARCSAYLPPVDLLCEKCWGEILSFCTPKVRSVFQNSFEVYSFWDWRFPEDDIGKLIKQRKSAQFDQAHGRLAGEILRGESAVFENIRSIVYPTKDPRKRDHTASLAQAFANVLQIPAIAVPISRDDEYKRHGQKKRLKNRRAGRFLAASIQHPIVFIDDVFTTGATARAVWRALGKPREFSVFVLAYKVARREGLLGSPKSPKLSPNSTG